VHGGVILFRGAGTAARRYLESDRSRADEYYLESGTALAEFTVMDSAGRVLEEGALTPEQYASWVDWVNPFTAESRGTPRLAGEGRQGSPRFAELVVNAPKSLSIAAALHPEVSDALDLAQQDALGEIRSWLGQHSVTRVGPRGKQQIVAVERLDSVAVTHRTSRAGDPHRHIHFQIGTRVWARGAWRGLDTAALFRQQGAIRALGTAAIAAHPLLATVLDRHGLSLDPVTGEVVELQPFNTVMSKRAEQVQANLFRFEAEWSAAHPGQTPGPVTSARLVAMAWDHGRPNKKPSRLGHEDAWRAELDAVGYTPHPSRAPQPRVRQLADLRVQELANRALDRCASTASTWTAHAVQEHVTRLITAAGVRANPADLRELVRLTTRLAIQDCLSMLPPDAVRPEHVAHLTTVRVIAVETALRDQLTRLAAASTGNESAALSQTSEPGIDVEQARAAAEIASDRPLVIVEAAAGAGKTTMLGVAFRAATAGGRPVRVVAPTKKAADVATEELGVRADSVAKLVHAHGWRWNSDGVWTRLYPGHTDPESGHVYTGPPPQAALRSGERIVVDEAGMLDQDCAHALLTIAAEAGATIALVGDRAQLPAVRRGGVLDIAAQLAGTTYPIGGVHRFTDPDYADITLQLRAGEDPAGIFQRLQEHGLIHLHTTIEDAHSAIAASDTGNRAITTATNDEARALNGRIREARVARGDVDDDRTTLGSDGLPIGAGDTIQTRRNDRDLHVANRQTWTVQHVGKDGTVWASPLRSGRKHRPSITLPPAYIAQHTHLVYACTAYGVQGTTVNRAHTLLTDALDSAGLYVGMTRGRNRNSLHIVAADLDDARTQFTAAITRDRGDRGLEEATRTATREIRGLIEDDSLTIVQAARADLAARIELANRQLATLHDERDDLHRQARTHQHEREQHLQRATAADAQLATTRAAMAAPLTLQATADAADVDTASLRMWAASAASRSAGMLTKRAARRAATITAKYYETARAVLEQRWGSTPSSNSAGAAWVADVVDKRLENDPLLDQLRREAVQAHRDLSRLLDRQTAENTTMRHQHARARTATHLKPHTTRAQAILTLKQLRDELESINALPTIDAAQLLHEGRTQRRVSEARTTPTPSADFAAVSPPSPLAPPPRAPRTTGLGL
jgi:hypothetical protein